MSQTVSSPILRALRRVALDQHLADVPDPDLLTRFLEQRDEAAFHALLRRHGPMVLDVCRAVVPNEADAEDAFQAVFLVFIRKARAIRKAASLASWLHGVAYRTALKAKAEFAKRQKHEARVPAQPAAQPHEPSWREIQQVVHEELLALSERHRTALVLCYLQGKTQDEAAAQLGLAKGTLKGRLERGRALLRERLVRRGLGPAVVVLASAWPAATATASVPPALVLSTARAAAQCAAGGAASASTKVAALAEGVMQFMFTTKLKLAALALLVLAAVIVAGGFAYHAAAQEEPKPEAALPPVKGPIMQVGGQRVDRFGDPLPDGLLHRFGSIRFRDANHMSNSAITADGRRLAVGSWKGVTVFDLETGKVVHHLNCEMENSWGGMSRLAISPDGTRVANVMSGCQLGVRDVASGKALFTLGELPRGLMAPSNHFIATLFSTDGKELIAVERTHLSFHDASTGAEKRRFAAPGLVLAISRDRQRFAAVTETDPDHLIVGDMTSGKTLAKFPIPRKRSDSSAMAFSPDGKTLATVEGETVIHLWDADTGRAKGRYEVPEPERSAKYFTLDSLAFMPDGQTLLAGSPKGIVRWNTTSGERLPKLPGHIANLWGMYVTPDGQRLISVGRDCTIRRWDLTTAKEIPPPEGYAWYTRIAYAPDNRTLAVADASLRVDLWEPATGKRRGTIRSRGIELDSIAFTADGQFLAAGHADGTIRFWDAASAEERRVLRPPGKQNAPVRLLAFSLDGQRMLSAAKDGAVQLWDLAAGKPLWDIPNEAYRKALFSPDGRWIAVARPTGSISIIDASSGAERHRVATSKEGMKDAKELAGMRFSPDGRTLITCHADGMLRRWETATGKLRSELKMDGHWGVGWEVTFSPDGRWLSYSDHRDTVCVCETATGKEVWWLNHDGLVTSVVFAADGKSLLTSTGANAYLWTLRPETGRPAEPAVLWTDLSGDDAAKAYRAVWALVDRPELTCRLLPQKLGGPVTVDVKQIEGWIEALDSKLFAERERAKRELAERAGLIEPLLQKALAKAKSLESITRIERLLQAVPTKLRADELGRRRGLQVLELINSPESRSALRTLANGSPGTPMTEDARAALARLDRLPR